MSATNAVILKKIYGSGMTALIISNKEMKDIMKIVKSLEESGLLRKGVSKTITLAACSLGKMLIGKAKISGRGILSANAGKIRADQNF